jgi:tetratricopeptide (TPR) repeat protein
MLSMAKSGVRHAVWILGLLMAGTLPKACSQVIPAAQAPVNPPPFNPAVWAWRNEEHWAVDQMVRDLVEQVVAVAGKDPAAVGVTTLPSGPRTYTVTLSGPGFQAPVTTTVKLVEHLWNPESLVPLVRDLARRLELAPGASAPGEDLETPLLNPTAAALEQTQARAAAALNRIPGSPAAQEGAAFVLGVFGLFDQAGAFQDHRGILCRMATHLALAEGLRTGPAGSEGRLARIELLVLEGRTAQAVAELDGLKADPGIPPAWLRVLYLSATGDWRAVPDPDRAGLAEALAAFKGRVSHLGADPGADWILNSARKDLPRGYLARVSLAGTLMSVGTGARLAPGAVDSDLSDLRAVYQLRKGVPLRSDPEVCAALAAHPGRSWNPASRQLEVLGWGLWAQHFQAILLDDMMRTIHFYAGQFGSRPDTQQYLDVLEQRFSGLEQFPVLQKRYANLRPEVYPGAILKAASFAQQHPELLSDCSWTSLNHSLDGAALPPAMPGYQAWLQDLVPFGTTCNWSYRVWEMAERDHLTGEEATRLLRLDPFNLFLIGDYFFTLYPGGQSSPEAVETACGPIKAFNRKEYLSRMMTAYPDHAPEILPWLRELASLDPNAQFSLAEELVARKRFPEASQVYLKAFQTCDDPVRAANESIWETLYLHRTGQDHDAERVAQTAAKVYSFRGLQALALLREAQGRLPEAEAEYRKIAARYDDGNVLPGFHYRNAGMRAEYQLAWAKESAAVFPEGMRAFQPAREPVPPSRGLVLQDYSAYLSHMGVARDAVVVALDGIKVDTFAQYALVRALDWKDPMKLTLYQGGKYGPIDLDSRRHGLGVPLIPYQPAKGVQP